MKASVTARPAPFFIGEHRALDFLNTVAAPWGETIEWIGSGRELLDWLVQAGLVPPAAAQRLLRAADDRQLDGVARRARGLREWFRGFVARHAGRPLEPAAVHELQPLNRLLARGETYRQVDAVPASRDKTAAPIGRAVRWRLERRWRAAEALFQPLAEAMGDLTCQADFRYVRRCERCTLWFLDVSRGHRRRWCTMAVCGNRAKAAAHRVRERG